MNLFHSAFLPVWMSSLQTVSLKLFGHKAFGQIVIGPIDLQGMNPVLDDLSLLFVLGLDHMFHLIYQIIRWLTNYSLMLLYLVRFGGQFFLRYLRMLPLLSFEQKKSKEPMYELSEAKLHPSCEKCMRQMVLLLSKLTQWSSICAQGITCHVLPAPSGQHRTRALSWFQLHGSGSFSRDSVEADIWFDVFCVSGLCERNAIRSLLVRLPIKQWGRQRQRPNPRVLHTGS